MGDGKGYWDKWDNKIEGCRTRWMGPLVCLEGVSPYFFRMPKSIGREAVFVSLAPTAVTYII